MNDFEGHYIIPVKGLVGTKYEYLISSPRNIFFLPKSDHIYVHGVGDTIAFMHDRLTEVKPSIAGTIKKLLKEVGIRGW